MTSPTWPEIVDRLRDTLARCDRDTDLELAAGPRRLHLLMRRETVRLHCPGYDEARLAALGWQRPPDGNGGWWYETPRTPERLDWLGMFVARTAAEVLTADPGALSCRALPPTPVPVPAARQPAATPAPPTPPANPPAPPAGGPVASVGGPDPVRDPDRSVAELLAEAADRRDLPGYLGVLSAATVCVPLAAEPNPDTDFPWTVATDSAGAPLLPVFTSPEVLTSFAGDGVPFVALACADLFADWPDRSWGLVVDPGTARSVALAAPALATLLAANTPAG
ncbi:SseB family protein [Micromonospora echinaurantiaca]|uniref:SseB family protein n=1 Tax=Micromonospora echinaurantiaca TaxID=47857 RepID=UPI003440E097